MKSPKVILTCKQVSRTLLEEHFDKLPWHRQLAVRFHLSWCWICGKFNKQVIEMQHGIDSYISHEDEDPGPNSPHISAEAKERILKAIQDKEQ